MDKIEKNTAPEMARFMWRPHAMTSTRAWTPIAERQDTDVELTINLRLWHALPAEVQRALNTAQQRIEVLNVDFTILFRPCQKTITTRFRPSWVDCTAVIFRHTRNRVPHAPRRCNRHEQLCRYENLARSAKKCCGFPDVAVMSIARANSRPFTFE
jgi:hypothetical protein